MITGTGAPGWFSTKSVQVMFSVSVARVSGLA